MDDRSYGCSTGGPLSGASTQERADDNRAAVEYLRKRSKIDPSRIDRLGLSEGGNIGPLIAASDPAIGALIIMAGCATNGWKIQEHQFRYDIERDEGLTDEELDGVVAEATTFTLANLPMDQVNAALQAVAKAKT